jgi:phosphatidylserine decarboxylase
MNWFYFLPHHGVARVVGWLARLKRPVAFKNAMIRWFIKHYAVRMDEASVSDYTQYKTFNDFFTRTLKPGIRPIAPLQNAIISPVDGFLYEFGKVTGGRLLQAKGRDYSLAALLAGDSALTQVFSNGGYATFYLAPKNYHRIHMPVEGRLCSTTYVPGRLFPVNSLSVNNVDCLFARNERVISIFETPFGKMALIAIGALNVGSIHTVWQGQVAPARKRKIKSWNYDADAIFLQRGEEWGYFEMGSSVILLFESDIHWSADLAILKEVRLGEKIAVI